MNALIVVVYASSRFVDHEGEDRSMLPFRGKETSSLCVSAEGKMVKGGVHDIDARAAKHGHALVMVETRVNRVDPDGIDAELFQIGQISSTILRRREGVNVRRAVLSRSPCPSQSVTLTVLGIRHCLSAKPIQSCEESAHLSALAALSVASVPCG